MTPWERDASWRVRGGRVQKETRTDRLYGIHPILEALKAEARQFEGIYLQHGRKGREVTEILRLARNQRVPVDFRPRDALDRMAGSAHHQGAVGVVAAKRYVAFDDLLADV